MQTRIRHETRFEPVGDARVPAAFVLVRTDTPETRRTDRELWRWDTRQAITRTELGTFTRRQVSELIADGADWLAYGGEDSGITPASEVLCRL